jgi:serine/threonine protein phosphatase PrpC
MRGLHSSPTFLVGSGQQRGILDEFQRRDQHLSEEYQKNKPLCFSSRAYQKTHPGKEAAGHRDADVTLSSPMMLGVADGVSQVEEYGIDASLLPKELLACCEELGVMQLIPDNASDTYRGPIQLLRRAFEGTEAMGSTTCLLALLDNSTRIHGKLHPMVAVITVGDCELLLLRRFPGRSNPLQVAFHTEMQRIDGHVQTPLQLARVDARIDPEFTEDITFEVIERGSAVHCVSAYEGDIVVMGSDGVFDNLFLDEVVDLCNAFIPPRPGNKFIPTSPQVLSQLAEKIVSESHAKAAPKSAGVARMRDTPIGRGGKIDDTSCVVGEVIEWTEAHSEAWAKVAKARRPAAATGLFGDLGFMSCGNGCTAEEDDDANEGMYDDNYQYHQGSSRPGGVSRNARGDSYDSKSYYDEEDDSRCAIA